jgi:hypothetical protein
MLSVFMLNVPQSGNLLIMVNVIMPSVILLIVVLLIAVFLIVYLLIVVLPIVVLLIVVMLSGLATSRLHMIVPAGSVLTDGQTKHEVYDFVNP